MKRLLTLTALLLMTIVSIADVASITLQDATNITQTKATLSAEFPNASNSHGFQYKYGTIPERTDFFNYATVATCDPLTFSQGNTAWRAVPRMGWVESPNDDPSSTLNAEFSTTFSLTEATTVSFDWQVNSEANIGVLSFYVDGTIVKSITGITEFETVSQSLSAGSHTLKWVYKRTTSENTGLGIGRVKNLNVQNTTVGTWIDAPTTSSTVRIENLYPSQNYIFRAYSTIGENRTYSKIQQFQTQGVSLGTPRIIKTTQTTATVECDVNPGDAEVSTGFYLLGSSVSQSSTSNGIGAELSSSDLRTTEAPSILKIPTFKDYFYDSSSELKPEPSYNSNYWHSSTSGYVYNTTKSDNQYITITFTLNNPGQISFDYKVSGGRINYVEDGTTIMCTSSTYTTITRNLVAGTHTIKWGSYYTGTYAAYIKNVNIGELEVIPVTISNGKITYTITNLKPNTKGTVQAFMLPAYTSPLENKWPVSSSESVSFTTKNVTTQTVNVTNLKQASATLNGSFDGGDATLVAKGIQYKNATNTRWSDVTTQEGDNTLTANIANLSPDTKYEWRTFIQAEGCEAVYSEVSEFTTEAVRAVKPVLVSVTQHTAKVQGEVIAGDATIYARGLEFRAVGTEEWESVEDLGADNTYVIDKTNLNLNSSYEARTYVQQAGNIFIYSDVLVFKTKNIEAFVDNISDVHQRNVTVHGHVAPGDDNVASKKIHIYRISGSSVTEVGVTEIAGSDMTFAQKITGLQPETKYGFIVEAINSEGNSGFSGEAENYKTLDNFTKALLSSQSSTAVTTTHDNTWYAGNGYVYMNTNYDGKIVTATFTLTKQANVTFDWKVKGTNGSSSKARINLYVDGASSTTSQITATSNTSYTSNTVTLNLAAGRHTLKWSSFYWGTYGAQISNLLIPTDATVNGGSYGAESTCTTLGFFDKESLQATNITQTTADFSVKKIATDEKVTYSFKYAKGEETKKVVAAQAKGENLSAQVTGLSQNTRYYYDVFVDLGDNTSYSTNTEKHFTTLPVGLNITMSKVTQTSAVAKVTVNAGTATITNLQYYLSDEQWKNVSGNINLTGLKPNTTYYIHFKYDVDGSTLYYTYEFKTFATSVSLYSSEVLQTSAMLRLSASVGTATYVSSGYELYEEQTALGNGESKRLTELRPNSEYTIRPYVTTTEGGTVYGKSITFRTKSITLTTSEPTSISNRSATLNGTIDCDSYSSAEFGMQWQEKTGWTTDPRFTIGHKNEDGTISLALVNGMLKPDTEYKFRTAVRYKGEIYYASSWKDLRTETEFIVYPATPYTMYRTDSEHNRLVLCGYYIAGSEDVVSQGYEYWRNNNKPNSLEIWKNAPSEDEITANGKQVVTTDESMEGFIDLSSLDEGTYTIRAFVTTTSSTYYGQQLTFTVGEPSALESVDGDEPACMIMDSQIIVKNAVGVNVRIIDINGMTIYNKRCDNIVETFHVQSGIYIVKIENGKLFKVVVQ